MTTFDYIVAGAGSAGCVLANRLSADPRVSVLLLEAGGVDRHPLLRIPKGSGMLFENEKYMWHYATTPFGPDQHSEQWMRGKVLGGSSSVNGLIYNRGHRPDYDGLEQLGNKGWGWDDLLPIFKSFEDNEFGASPTRGIGGPLHISVPKDPEPLCEEMLDAATRAGLTRVQDINESDDERVGYATSTIRDGRRVSAATAFLKPALGRPNLTVTTRTVVHRILIENGRATGLRVHGPRGAADVHGRNIIVSLGSLNSPRLLQLSGIGPREVLRAAGVPVVLERENVGRRMREHRCATVRYRLNADLGYNKMISTSLGQALTGMKYLATRRGPLGAPSFDIVGFAKVRAESDRVDGQIMMGPYSLPPYNKDGEPVRIEREPGLSCLGMALRPTSEGSVEITGSSPDAALRIEPNYLTSPEDRATTAALLRRMRAIFEQSPIAERISHETYPGPDVHSDSDLVDSALLGGYCGYHAIGTCAMGSGDDDVVDDRMRVRGIENLRVIDCSVLPVMVAGNLNGPIMAIAARAAELILGD